MFLQQAHRTAAADGWQPRIGRGHRAFPVSAHASPARLNSSLIVPFSDTEWTKQTTSDINSVSYPNFPTTIWLTWSCIATRITSIRETFLSSPQFLISPLFWADIYCSPGNSSRHGVGGSREPVYGEIL